MFKDVFEDVFEDKIISDTITSQLSKNIGFLSLAKML